MTTQTVTLTAREIENPALLLNAIVNAGLGESAVYLYWNIAVLRGATQYVALNKWAEFPLAERVAEFDSWKSTKYQSKFDSARAKNSATPTVQPSVSKTAESPKTALKSEIRPMPETATPTAESMSLAQWLESQYGLAESAVDAVILTLADSHIETYQLLIDSAIDLFGKDSPLGKSSKAYKKQTSAIRKAIATESTRRKVYAEYINTPATPTESAVIPTESATPTVQPTLTLESLGMAVQAQGAMLAALLEKLSAK